MLAARARGIGSAWTTLHLRHEQAIAEMLDIPHEQFMQVALIPLAYTKGTQFQTRIPPADRDRDAHRQLVTGVSDPAPADQLGSAASLTTTTS